MWHEPQFEQIQSSASGHVTEKKQLVHGKTGENLGVCVLGREGRGLRGLFGLYFTLTNHTCHLLVETDLE